MLTKLPRSACPCRSLQRQSYRRALAFIISPGVVKNSFGSNEVCVHRAVHSVLHGLLVYWTELC